MKLTTRSAFRFPPDHLLPSLFTSLPPSYFPSLLPTFPTPIPFPSIPLSSHSATVLYYSLWLEDGCVTEDTDTGDVLCKCNHLTSFAVLMRYTDYVAEEEMETTALTLIGYIGIAVSLFCLITTFSVFIYLE